MVAPVVHCESNARRALPCRDLPVTLRETEAAPAFEFLEFDKGRLIVNRRFVDIFHQNGLLTFESLYSWNVGQVVRRIKSRSTTRIELNDAGGRRAFYLKRHEPPQFQEWLRPLLNLGRPVLGSRNEWNAIQWFHAAGIPTMTPVAFGEADGRSLLVTEDLQSNVTLLDWVNSFCDAGPKRPNDELQRALIARVAALACRMHQAGIHHQDFYLNHMLLCGHPSTLDVRVIDLGRAGRPGKLSRRWILKDLSQLDFSARRLSCADRLRFLRLYLGRPFSRSDRRLVRLIAVKSRRIAKHTAKHRL
ncbi:MAG: lipopolysaccharide core heptose(I) kinase RfaP [Planctomycetia bacterium]|nr:lipopolysaccharide core heptose(I) kinase RfaP [Planctomycetia bacterium]